MITKAEKLNLAQMVLAKQIDVLTLNRVLSELNIGAVTDADLQEKELISIKRNASRQLVNKVLKEYDRIFIQPGSIDEGTGKPAFNDDAKEYQHHTNSYTPLELKDMAEKFEVFRVVGIDGDSADPTAVHEFIFSKLEHPYTMIVDFHGNRKASELVDRVEHGIKEVVSRAKYYNR